MIVFICENCGAHIKNQKPKNCPLCKKTEFRKFEKEEEQHITTSSIHRHRLRDTE